ncbi:hypothetical protein VTK56DRAFT_4657 [Thermocarpiscus australiensis]
MRDLGSEPLASDICLFRHWRHRYIFVILFVDDFLVAAPTIDQIHQIREGLRRYFDLKELGEVERFLGFDVVRDRAARKVFLSQQTYNKALLAKYDLQNCHPVQTPWKSRLELPPTWDPVVEEQKAYIKKTGALNWLANGTRPDIAYTVSRLCEANNGPSDTHLELMKHLFRYLRGTIDYGLEFGGTDLTIEDLKLMAFADASFADRLPTRHPTGGHVVFVAGGPVLWKTKKQSFVAMSTTEAEFANLTPTAYSAKWVAKILTELGAPQPVPRVLFTDSKNAYLTTMACFDGSV